MKEKRKAIFLNSIVMMTLFAIYGVIHIISKDFMAVYSYPLNDLPSAVLAAAANAAGTLALLIASASATIIAVGASVIIFIGKAPLWKAAAISLLQGAVAFCITRYCPLFSFVIIAYYLISAFYATRTGKEYFFV